MLFDRSVSRGDISRVLEPLTLLRLVMGVANINNGPAWQANAYALIDILIDGLCIDK